MTVGLMVERKNGTR